MTPRTHASRRNGGSNGAGSSYRVLDDILAMAGSLADSRKEYAAEKLETLAGSVRDFAGAVPGMENFRTYVDAAAESLEGLADYVTQSDLETMVEDAREFARAHPMTMLAASVVVGVVATQMVQARGTPFGRGKRQTPRTRGSKRAGGRGKVAGQRNRANA